MNPPRSLDDVRARIAADPVTGTPAARRAAFERLAGPQPALAATAVGPHGALAVGDGPTLLFFHGGGFVFGSPESHAAMAAAIAAEGVRVVLPRYRLAPEAQWPAMLDDAAAALDAVPGRVAVGGVSAGGHLALALALLRPERVAAVALLSPNTDRAASEPLRRAGASDALNDDAADRELAALAGLTNVGDPLVSPVRADVSALPPLHIEVGAHEVLLGDSLRLAERAALAAVDVSLIVTARLFHMAALWPAASPAAAGQLARIGRFVRDRAAVALH